MTVLAGQSLIDAKETLSEIGKDWLDLRGARIFFTGGTGFFGKGLLETFVFANESLSLGASAVVLTRNPDAFRHSMPLLSSQPCLQLLQGDTRDFEFPKGAFSHVIHAATPISQQAHSLELADTIIGGTRRALDFARASGATRFLLTSSGAVYGKQPSNLHHIPESYASGPNLTDLRSTYGESKRMAELLCSISSNSYGIKTMIARGFAFIGPHLPLDAHFAVGNFIRDALAGGPIRIQGNGTPYRSYLYASDLATWLWTILLRGTPCHPYNVGSENEISIADLAREVIRVINPEVRLEVEGVRLPNETPDRYVPSNKRAREELSLRETVSLEEAIRRTAKAHQSRG